MVKTLVPDVNVIEKFFDFGAVHGFDSNGDGIAGMFVRDTGGIKLSETADGRLYADSILIKRAGYALTRGRYAAYNYETFAAGVDNGNKFVALRRPNGIIWEWDVDDNWTFVEEVGVHQLGSARQGQLENYFN